MSKMSMRDVVEWIEELYLDDKDTIEIVKRYKINGLVLSKLDKDDDLCNFGVEAREATEIFRALQDIKHERARVVEALSSITPSSPSSSPLGDPPKEQSEKEEGKEEEEEEDPIMPNDGFLFRAAFETKEEEIKENEENEGSGPSITWTDAVVASFDEKETLSYIVNRQGDEEKGGKKVLYEIRGDFGKLGALSSSGGVDEGARVIPPGTKLNVISVSPDCYFPDVTRVIVEIC